GMTDPHFTDINQYRDIESLNAYHNMKNAGYDEQEILKILSQKSRDNARTPVQWTSGAQAGFTSGDSWIDIPKNFDKINVEAAIQDEQSILQTYRRLIQLRHEYDIITYGSVEPLYMNHEALFVYKRHLNDETWLIIANFSNVPVDLPVDINLTGEVMIQNGHIENDAIGAYSAIVVAQ
ncbi:DUF3459 domain-containing protein, partial [Staphylococcus succinus]